ncbi:MAG: serine/threonine-protein kinase [Myxococcota bacterium]
MTSTREQDVRTRSLDGVGKLRSAPSRTAHDVPTRVLGASRRPVPALARSPLDRPRGDLPTTVLHEPDGSPRDIDGLPAPSSDACLPIAGEDPLFQGDFVGRYSVLSRLGRGGMGVVYKAYDPQLDRNVALKVLDQDGATDPTDKEIRLLREAQTLAKLRHANIVAVYDVGLSPRGMFIAMELIEGRTLGSWLDEQPRRSREIVRMFWEAGQGLAAAHGAGIVHRDFKPSNALVGDDGVVRVLDFGLAQLVDSEPSNKGQTTQNLTVAAISRLLESGSSATETGVLMGTPAFMAPEQLRREKVDERSDQYTFCLCLHLALGGALPERGDDLDELIEQLGRPPRRPVAGGISARVRRALDRGLSRDPAARFESMSALLAELAERPRRWRTVVAASMLGVGFSLGALSSAADWSDPCADPHASLEGVWGNGDKQEIRDAFLGSGHADAASLLKRVEGQLDGYAQVWTEVYDKSCRATYAEHEQSTQLFDRQVLCLERRRSQLRATIDALARADGPQAVVSGTVLPFKLPMLDDCIDPESLSSQPPLPEDLRQREAIEQLRRRIDEAQARASSGDSQSALAVAQAVVEQARGIDYAPVLAEALGVLGSLQASGSSARDAESTLIEALRVAASAKTEEVEARAWTWLMYALLIQGRVEEGIALELSAELAVERTGDRVAEGWMLNNLGGLYSKAGESERAVDYLRRALEVKQSTLGPDHVDVAISWYNLGNALTSQERHGEAYEAFTRALEGFERTVGEAHPMTHHVMVGLCSVEQKRGHIQEAVALCDRVIEHLEDSPWSTVSMGEVRYIAAVAHWKAGRADWALELARRAHEQVAGENPTMAREIEQWLDDRAPRSGAGASGPGP